MKKFWGLEVRPGQSVKVSPENNHLLYLSQGALGEVKIDDKATLFVKVDDQKLSIGTLSNDRFPRIQFDLVFEKEFELSHTSTSSSVFFSGYKVFQEEEKIISATKENGKAEAKDNEPKQVNVGSAVAAKPKAEAEAAVGKSKMDTNSNEESDDESDDDSIGRLIPIGDSDDLCESSDSDDEDEETLKKPVLENEKVGSMLKTPADGDSVGGLIPFDDSNDLSKRSYSDYKDKETPKKTGENSAKLVAGNVSIVEPKQVKVGSAAAANPKANADAAVGKNMDTCSADESDDESGDDSVGRIIPIHDCDDLCESSDSDDEEDEDSDDEEDEETPKKQEAWKMKAAGSVLKTPASDKKAKIVTPSHEKGENSAKLVL